MIFFSDFTLSCLSESWIPTKIYIRLWSNSSSGLTPNRLATGSVFSRPTDINYYSVKNLIIVSFAQSDFRDKKIWKITAGKLIRPRLKRKKLLRDRSRSKNHWHPKETKFHRKNPKCHRHRVYCQRANWIIRRQNRVRITSAKAVSFYLESNRRWSDPTMILKFGYWWILHGTTFKNHFSTLPSLWTIESKLPKLCDGLSSKILGMGNVAPSPKTPPCSKSTATAGNDSNHSRAQPTTRFYSNLVCFLEKT